MTELPVDENTPRILIVEDEPKLGQLLIDYLQAAGYAPTLINHGDKVLPYVRQTPPHLILLDLMLPGTDGLTLCREIRRFSDVPVVMVTAKIEEIDRLLGLEIGADDYICKPYSPREVVARVKTILRRCKPQRDLQALDAQSPLIVDEGRFQASWRDKLLDLTPAEFRLLKTLSQEPGKVFSREQLLNHLYDDYRVVTDRTIDSHIKILRRKLAAVEVKYGQSEFEKRHFALHGLMCIYGIELLPDNIAECRSNLLEIFAQYLDLQEGDDLCRAASFVLTQNLVHGDALTMQSAGKQPITFAEWGYLGKGKFLRCDFRFDVLTHSSAFSAEDSLFAHLGKHEIFTPIKAYAPMTVAELARMQEESP